MNALPEYTCNRCGENFRCKAAPKAPPRCPHCGSADLQPGREESLTA